MKRMLIGSLLFAAVACWSSAAPVKVTTLRCEYGTNPLGIVTPAPRLCWVLESPERGALQSAYRVLVATSPEVLLKDKGDLWDSGKVTNSQSIQVVYRGKALGTAQQCFWKVRVWDQGGKASAWSEPASWTMGLLAPMKDWQAKWIGCGAPVPPEDPETAALNKHLSLAGHSWMWAFDAKPTVTQPAGKVYFRKNITIPANQKVKQAMVVATADNSFELRVNGHPAGLGSGSQKVHRLDITGRLQAGLNAIGFEVNNVGEHPNPAGLIGKVIVLLADGAQIIPIDNTWLTSHAPAERWDWADAKLSGWQPAKPVAKLGDKPWGELKSRVERLLPAPYFRKEFTVQKPIKRALLFASALGLYELHLNGAKVDTDVLSPGWTDYRKRVHYFTYNVTKQIQKGDNAIGAIVGDGWYAGYLAFTGRRHYYGENPRLLVQLLVEFQDGTRDVLGTDSTWRSAFGPIREADLLMGCVYDARLEMPGWDKANFADSKWSPAEVDATVKTSVEAHPGAPIRRMQEVKAIKRTEPAPCVYVYDLGQNMVGWMRLKAKGHWGQKVTVRYAEMLNPDGTLYLTNLRAAKATDTFYLMDGAARNYEPSFTTHGFRYVEVSGLVDPPALSDVTGIVVHSDLPQTGFFECDNPLVNKLMLNTLWGQKGNFLDVPTDCPQRDERAGWTGDAQVFMKTACYNLYAPGFYTKWLVDLCQDSQHTNGGFGDVAPHIDIVRFGNTGWSEAGLVCPWQMWRLYGDQRAVGQHYANMTNNMNFLANTSSNYVRGTGAYGDWLRLSGPQHSDAIGTAYYYYAATIMAELARVTGHTGDAERYQLLAHKIREVFVEKFITEDWRIVDSKGETSQSFYALAFGLDLVPERMQAGVAKNFAAEIKKQDDHLATGFLGTPFVLFALQKAGLTDLAYKLVLNETYPSWLLQVKLGATTMWERWDGWLPDKGFQDPGMNSFNHYWLGCVGEWLYTSVAGIDLDTPGFQTINIKPTLASPGAKGFNHVKASYNSLRGRIASEWTLKDGELSLSVTVPGNTTAKVCVPAAPGLELLVDGKPANKVPDVKATASDERSVTFTVGSGTYRFTSHPFAPKPATKK